MNIKRRKKNDILCTGIKTMRTNTKTKLIYIKKEIKGVKHPMRFTV